MSRNKNSVTVEITNAAKIHLAINNRLISNFEPPNSKEIVFRKLLENGANSIVLYSLLHH